MIKNYIKNRCSINLRLKLVFLLAIAVNLSLFGQLPQDSIPKPYWEIFYGDSMIIKSNVEVRNSLRPSAIINFEESAKNLTINIFTFYQSTVYFTILKFLYNNTEIHTIRNLGLKVVFTKEDILSTLSSYKGKVIKITYEDFNFQKTPTILGYLHIR